MATTPGDGALPLLLPDEALARARAGTGYWRSVGERLRGDKITIAVTLLLLAIILMAIFAPLVVRHDPLAGSAFKRLKPIGTEQHWLGTDEVGRDLWSRMVYGGRLSLFCGVLPVFLALLTGGSLGVLAGFAGGVVNTAIMRS